MQRYIIFILIHISFSQPGTDIYLFDLTFKNGIYNLSNPVQLTKKKGYDNQPFFHTSLPILYYSSANDSGITDVMTYNYIDGKTANFTKTDDDREYSPTLTPDKKFISTIIQRKNGAQDFGKYPLEGGKPIILLSKYKVGYHAWANKNIAVFFILGKPHKMHLIDFDSGTDEIISENIGRSFHTIPSENAFSYIQKTDGKNHQIMRFDLQSKKSTFLAETIEKSEDIAWTNKGYIITSDGKNLFQYQPGKSGKWVVIANLEDFNLKKVSRIAINSQGNKIAIVSNE